MQLDLVFLPLLAGYIFFNWFYGTRYQASKFPAQRLVFPAAVFGLAFIAVARALELLRSVVVENIDVWLTIVWRMALPGSAASLLLATLMAIAARSSQAPKYFRNQQHTIFQTVVFLLGSTAIFVVTADLSFSQVTLSALVLTSFAYLAMATIIAFCVWALTKWPFFGLLFRSSAALLVLTIAFVNYVARADVLTETVWADFSTVSKSGLPFASLIVGLLALLVANMILPRFAAASFIQSRGATDELRRALFAALDKDHPVLVDLKDGKSYVGHVKSLPPAVESADGYFVLLPGFSGYRDKDTRRFVPTTFYDPIYQQLDQELRQLAKAEIDARLRRPDLNERQRSVLKASLEEAVNVELAEVRERRLERFYRVFPISSVMAMGRFDADVFLRFGASDSAAPPNARAVPDAAVGSNSPTPPSSSMPSEAEALGGGNEGSPLTTNKSAS